MNVLVAVDDSEFAKHVGDFVAAHQWPVNAQFTVLHVVPSLLPVTAVLPAPVIEQLHADQKRAATEILESVGSQLRAKGYAVESMIVEGEPKRQILSVALQKKVQTIVLGSHGRSGLEKWMLGSVSLSVASSAHCSVMIVRPQHHDKLHSSHAKEQELAS